MKIGITTAPRNQVYLHQTIDSMCAATALPLHIVIAPTLPDEHADRYKKEQRPNVTFEVLAPLYKNQKALEAVDWKIYGWDSGGNSALEVNTDRLMRHMLSISGGAAFVTAQDDIILCKQAIDQARRVAEWMAEQPHVAATTFYNPRQRPIYSSIAELKWRDFYGELFMLWNPGAAAEFLNAADAHPGAMFARTKQKTHDCQLNVYFANTRWLLRYHNPCLVQHVGVDSATGKQWENRVTPMFSQDYRAIQMSKAFPKS